MSDIFWDCVDFLAGRSEKEPWALILLVALLVGGLVWLFTWLYFTKRKPYKTLQKENGKLKKENKRIKKKCEQLNIELSDCKSKNEELSRQVDYYRKRVSDPSSPDASVFDAVLDKFLE